MTRLINLSVLFSLILITGCDTRFDDPVPEASYGYSYYPLQVGKYFIFRIDSIQFDIQTSGIPIKDTGCFFLKEEFTNSYRDASGNEIFRVERSRSANQEGPWIPVDVISSWRNSRQGFRTENNLKIIPLVFPVHQGTLWDGLIFIPEGIQVNIRGESIEFYKDWSFKVLSVDQAESIGGVEYPEIATVQHADNENLIELRYAVEKYAKGIGLVSREYQILDTYCKYEGDNTPCQGVPWPSKAGRGFILNQMLVDHN